MKTEGSRLLAATGLDHASIAAELGVARATVTQWLGGDKRPGAGRREMIAKIYGVPSEAWDLHLQAQAVGAAQAAAAAGVTAHFDAEARLRAQLSRLDGIRASSADDAQLPPQARLRLEATETRCIELLSKLTGEGQEISEARILRMPAWRRVQDAIIEALRPWPDASVAVMAALKEIGG